MPTEYQIGDRVQISVESFQNIKNGNRSLLAFPADSYVRICFELMASRTLGTVECRWFPGYEVNVKFDNGQILQMKDHWIEKVL